MTYASIRNLLESISTSLVESHCGVLAAVSLVPARDGTKQLLFAPKSITELQSWDRVGKVIGYEADRAGSLSVIRRLLEFREFLISERIVDHNQAEWNGRQFWELAENRHAITQAEITRFESACTLSKKASRPFDQRLHLICCRFLYTQLMKCESLGRTGSECCTLYMQVMELLDHELPHSRQLKSQALSAVRTLLVDDQWNVGEDGCQLKFKAACEAMIRAIQLGVLQWVVDG